MLWSSLVYLDSINSAFMKVYEWSRNECSGSWFESCRGRFPACGRGKVRRNVSWEVNPCLRQSQVSSEWSSRVATWHRTETKPQRQLWNVHQRNACAEARDDCRHYRHRVPSHCQRSCVRSLPITYHWASITGQERTYTFALNESERFDGIGIRVFHANLHLHRPLHHGGRLERWDDKCSAPLQSGNLGRTYSYTNQLQTDPTLTYHNRIPLTWYRGWL